MGKEKDVFLPLKYFFHLIPKIAQKIQSFIAHLERNNLKAYGLECYLRYYTLNYNKVFMVVRASVVLKEGEMEKGKMWE